MRQLPSVQHSNISSEQLGGFPSSILLATRSADFSQEWPDVVQGIRKGPTKAHWSPNLKRLAKEAVDNADWFHGHGLYVWPNKWLGTEARRRNKPLVYHPQGFFDPWILRRSIIKKKIAHLLFEDANIKYVMWWRAVSSKEAVQIRAVIGHSARIHIIPNGIDVHEIDAANAINLGNQSEESMHWRKQRRPKRLLFLSRIHPKKGLDLLISAWSRLTREFPDWELLIVGPNEGGYQSKVEKMIADSGCSETCWLHPPVSGGEKYLVMRSSDLFVLPSYSEGFPMAVLEAAANCIPVVHTDECNFSELTACSGAWECTVDSEALHKTLREALGAEDSERTERGLKGREVVVKNYSWNKIARLVTSACEEFSCS